MPVLVGIDGDKHSFKSTFSKAVRDELRPGTRAVLIDADFSYDEGMIVDGEVWRREGWNWKKLADDIRRAMRDKSIDAIIVNGYELFMMCHATDISATDFALKVSLIADAVTRQWVHYAQDGYEWGTQDGARRKPSNIIQKICG